MMMMLVMVMVMMMIMHEACLYGMPSSTSLVIFPWGLFECSSASCAGSQVQALSRQKPLDPKNAEMKEFHLLLKTSHDHAVSLMGPIGES